MSRQRVVAFSESVDVWFFESGERRRFAVRDASPPGCVAEFRPRRQRAHGGNWTSASDMRVNGQIDDTDWLRVMENMPCDLDLIKSIF